MNSLQHIIFNYFVGMGKTESIPMQVNALSMFEEEELIVEALITLCEQSCYRFMTESRSVQSLLFFVMNLYGIY